MFGLSYFHTLAAFRQCIATRRVKIKKSTFTSEMTSLKTLKVTLISASTVLMWSVPYFTTYISLIKPDQGIKRINSTHMLTMFCNSMRTVSFEINPCESLKLLLLDHYHSRRSCLCRNFHNDIWLCLLTFSFMLVFFNFSSLPKPYVLMVPVASMPCQRQ